MQNADFTLRSGIVLHVSSAPWSKAIALWSAVKLATIGMKENPDVGAMILASPSVQASIESLYPWATYNSVKMYPGLFDETKNGDQARGDYLEICEKLIEFHLRPFFLMTSSKSTVPPGTPTESPQQP